MVAILLVFAVIINDEIQEGMTDVPLIKVGLGDNLKLCF